jgi:hypothetical protein
MAFVAGKNVAVQVLEALGLNVPYVLGLTISVKPDDVVRITLEVAATVEQVDAVTALLTNSGGQVVVNEVVAPTPKRHWAAGCCDRNADNMACDCPK